jgi:hypothetical protein
VSTVERGTPIRTTGGDTNVATFTASELVGGQERIVQIISLTAGKIPEFLPPATRSVSSDDTMDITTVSGNVVVGDNSILAVYPQHSQPTGSCLVTPLLCDNGGNVVGCLNTQAAKVMLPVVSGIAYFSPCLTWSIMNTGAWYVYPHISELSSGNDVNIWCFTF